MRSRTAEEIARAAKRAFESSGLITSEERSTTLFAVRAELERNKDAILAANRKDMEVGLCIYYNTSPLTRTPLCRLPMNKSNSARFRRRWRSAST